VSELTFALCHVGLRASRVDLVREVPEVVDRNANPRDGYSGIALDEAEYLVVRKIRLSGTGIANRADDLPHVWAADENGAAAGRPVTKQDAGVGIHSKALLDEASCR
jgi:hypothetical protein